ncbi:FmdE family protein [Bacteroidota bacterium]
MKKPRAEIISLIDGKNLEQLLIMAGQIHGHYCPGLALGIIAAQRAMIEMCVDSDGLEDLIAISETNNCFSDGIQFVTGCTFGNNSLVFRDFGKTAFTLCTRNGSGIRICVRSEAREYMHNIYPSFSADYNNVVKEKDHSENSIKSFKISAYEKAIVVLSLDFDKLFIIDKEVVNLPDYAPSHESQICEHCKESVMDSRIVNIKGKNFCIPCSKDDYFQLDGHGISKIINKK